MSRRPPSVLARDERPFVSRRITSRCTERLEEWRVAIVRQVYVHHCTMATGFTDPINEDARSFYMHYEFQALGECACISR